MLFWVWVSIIINIIAEALSQNINIKIIYLKIESTTADLAKVFLGCFSIFSVPRVYCSILKSTQRTSSSIRADKDQSNQISIRADKDQSNSTERICRLVVSNSLYSKVYFTQFWQNDKCMIFFPKKWILTLTFCLNCKCANQQ